MTTHVLIVDERTLQVHLQYMFVGTGSRENVIDTIVNQNSALPQLHHSQENGLVEMIADGQRVRRGDFIIFYLRQSANTEGGFYGIFRAVDDGIFLEDFSDTQYLWTDLQKSLTFRFKIEPYEVYAAGVTEWEALDVIRDIHSPHQMLWSLIYRKLKGNRGNTMVTIYEAERLFGLIRRKNNFSALPQGNYTFVNNKITVTDNHFVYQGNTPKIDILPRLIVKYNLSKAHEAHLQAYITQEIGKRRNVSLEIAIGVIPNKLEWIGNEVSCGVGMQRIDILLSQNIDDATREILPIELKCVEAQPYNVHQIDRKSTRLNSSH